MTRTATSDTTMNPPLLAVALLSAAALGYEVLLTRMLSIIQWHHFAYMIISVCLLGYGVAGAVALLAENWLLARFRVAFSVSAALFGISAVGCFLLTQRVGFNPLEILWDPEQPWRLGLIYLLLLVPFFFAALTFCLAFARFPDQVSRIYAVDILGAGFGSLGVILALFLLTPVHVLYLLGSMALVAGSMNWGKRMTAGIALAALLAMLAMPANWGALHPSAYKDLSVALLVQGARAVEERSSPMGLLTVVESPKIPFRYAPGMSLSAINEVPEQLGVFTDGNGLSPIVRFDGRREPLAYMDQLTSALPYHLLEKPKTLILGAGSGADVLQAHYHRVPSIDAVELNPQLIDLVQNQFGDYSGRPFTLPGVTLRLGEARGFVAGLEESWDLIQVTLMDAFGASSAGLHALSESYLYTVEGLQEYLSHLQPGGVLALTRWVNLPPRDILKLFGTAVTAMEQMGVEDAKDRLVLIRGWKTSTLVIKNGVFTPKELQRLRVFSRARSFDIDYAPGLQPKEVNRYNRLDSPYFYEGALALLGPNRDDFLDRYKFNLTPASDDDPFFFQYFKWKTLPEFLRLKEQGGLPLLEWGYPVLVATLIQATLVSVLLIILPLWFRPGRGEQTERVEARRILGYFTLIGCSFMFLEIAFIQKFILFLSHPLYAVAVVLCGFLIFAGVGSFFSRRWEESNRLPRRVILAIAGIALAYLWLLPDLFPSLMGLPDWAKIGFSLALISPLAFFMGMPFPLGLSQLGREAPKLIPWAWGVNACSSVVSAILATLLAIHLGFNEVVLAGIAMYGLTLLTFPKVKAAVSAQAFS